MNEHIVIGLDVGGTNIRIGAQEPDSGLLCFKKVSRELFLGQGHSLDVFSGFIQDYLSEYFPRNTVDAVMIGFPSILSVDKRIVIQTPNIPGLDNIPMTEYLEKRLGIKVFIEKDVNILFLWDTFTHNIPARGIGIGLYFGTGIGNAISINGELLTGKDGAVGELGHIPVIGGKGDCGCGNSACAECYASGRHLVELRDRYFKSTEIHDLFTLHGETEVLREFVDALACVAAAEINILNPHYIILGGGVPDMPDFPRELLLSGIARHTRSPFPRNNLQIYFSPDSVQNGVLGAIRLARIRLGI